MPQQVAGGHGVIALPAQPAHLPGEARRRLPVTRQARRPMFGNAMIEQDRDLVGVFACVHPGAHGNRVVGVALVRTCLRWLRQVGRRDWCRPLGHRLAFRDQRRNLLPACTAAGDGKSCLTDGCLDERPLAAYRHCAPGEPGLLRKATRLTESSATA
jgi:hypothetical protein